MDLLHCCELYGDHPVHTCEGRGSLGSIKVTFDWNAESARFRIAKDHCGVDVGVILSYTKSILFSRYCRE